MSSLKNTGKRMFNLQYGRGFKTNDEIRAERKMKRQNALNKIYQSAEMPDPEEELRKGRKKAAGRMGSRASTVLTDDTLG